MCTPKFSLSLILLFSIILVLLSLCWYFYHVDICSPSRHCARHTYTFFSYATCNWPEIFIQTYSVLFFFNTSSNSMNQRQIICFHFIMCVMGMVYQQKFRNSPGPGCSKLTTSLVNVSLKFQTLIAEIIQYFC